MENNCFDWNTTIQLLKIVFSFPSVCLVTLFFILYYFKTPILDFLNNVIEVKYGKASAQRRQSPPENKKEIPHTLDNQSEAEQMKALAYFWEYNYLDYYLVYNSKKALCWFYRYSSEQNKITYLYYDASFKLSTPNANERVAIIAALTNHYLILHNPDKNNESFYISPKGKEYVDTKKLLDLFPQP